ncbi:unnamed protein product [Bursaphelenchus okinawaensis]|uniref:RRM domain-containing protein n=1 Tax=Bursaphelenchus okinawaensis TaxID=465554 RepID=A0A811L1M2_9BILA|nr:unnamed protein product [Bursaphelenchus okinawaensis]CAG9114573.1 unnamed protein product [Bursaphelenchus okinawaensis]
MANNNQEMQMEVAEIDFEAKLKEIEEEAKKIKSLQANQPPLPTTGRTSPQAAKTMKEKQAQDLLSIFVGNVDYSATPESLQQHFAECGTVDRVTILLDKFRGNPKGFAYVKFADLTGKIKAMELDESLFLGRQIKVSEKRTNQPGISTTNRPPRHLAQRPRGGFNGRGRPAQFGGAARGPVRTIVKYVYPTSRGGKDGPFRGRGRPF